MVMKSSKSQEFSSVKELAIKGMSQGVSAGIEAFILRRKLDVSPGPGSPAPVAAFTVALLAEFDNKPNSIYPFQKSIKEQLSQVMEATMPYLNDLWINGEMENALALARTIFYGETLIFLDENLKEVISLIKAIRETPIQMN